MQKLADEFLPHVHKFVKEMKHSLDAYLSRFEQVFRLKQTFKEDEVYDIQYNFDLTRVDFALDVGEVEDSENKVTVKLGIPFQYVRFFQMKTLSLI